MLFSHGESVLSFIERTFPLDRAGVALVIETRRFLSLTCTFKGTVDSRTRWPTALLSCVLLWVLGWTPSLPTALALSGFRSPSETFPAKDEAGRE